MLNYENTQASIPVAVKSGSKITVETVRQWTSVESEKKTSKTYLRIIGDLSERGATWHEEWVIDWPDTDLKKLEEGLGLIHQHVNSRGNLRNGCKKDAFVLVYDWLRIGWIDEGGSFYGYIRIMKDGKFMESSFENYAGIADFRNALSTALAV